MVSGAGRWLFKRSVLFRWAVLVIVAHVPHSVGRWIDERVGLVESMLRSGVITPEDIRRSQVR